MNKRRRFRQLDKSYIHNGTCVVIGGGVAAVSCIKQLSAFNIPNMNIILISASPILKDAVITQHVTQHIEEVDVQEISHEVFSQLFPHIRLIIDTVIQLNSDQKYLTLQGGDIIQYNKCCICTGSVPYILKLSSSTSTDMTSTTTTATTVTRTLQGQYHKSPIQIDILPNKNEQLESLPHYMDDNTNLHINRVNSSIENTGNVYDGNHPHIIGIRDMDSIQNLLHLLNKPIVSTNPMSKSDFTSSHHHPSLNESTITNNGETYYTTYHHKDNHVNSINTYERIRAAIRRKQVVVVGNGGIALEMITALTICDIHWIIKDNHIGNTYFDPYASIFLIPQLRHRLHLVPPTVPTDMCTNSMLNSNIYTATTTTTTTTDDVIYADANHKIVPNSIDHKVEPNKSYIHTYMHDITPKVIIETSIDHSLFNSTDTTTTTTTTTTTATTNTSNQKTKKKSLGSALGPNWTNKTSFYEQLSSTSLDNDGKIYVYCNQSVHSIEDLSIRDQDPEKLKKSLFPLLVTTTAAQEIECDIIICAIGVTSHPTLNFLGSEFDRNTSDGTILVNRYMESNIPDIYAAGDCCTYHNNSSRTHKTAYTTSTNSNVVKHITSSTINDDDINMMSYDNSDIYNNNDKKITKNNWLQMKLWTQARSMGIYVAHCMIPRDIGEPDMHNMTFELFAHTTTFLGHKVILLGQFNGQNIKPFINIQYMYSNLNGIENNLFTLDHMILKYPNKVQRVDNNGIKEEKEDDEDNEDNEDDVILLQFKVDYNGTMILQNTGYTSNDKLNTTLPPLVKQSYTSDDISSHKKSDTCNHGDTDIQIWYRIIPSKQYIKLFIHNTCIIGATLIGNTDLEETIENLILNHTNVIQYGIQLLDPLYDIDDYFD